MRHRQARSGIMRCVDCGGCQLNGSPHCVTLAKVSSFLERGFAAAEDCLLSHPAARPSERGRCSGPQFEESFMGQMRFYAPMPDKLLPHAVDLAYVAGLEAIPWYSRNHWMTTC